MSYIGNNIRKIRAVKKLSQAAFAELFGLARPSVGAYEEGRSEPKMETLIQIAHHFGLSVDLLLTKELTVNDLYGFDIFQQDLQAAAPAEASPVAVADQLAALTPYVRADRLLEYIVHYHDKAFVDALPALTFPHMLGPATRAFEIQGAEMQHQQQGLRHQDVVLCRRIDRAAPALRSGRIYAFVTPNRLLVRRLVERLPDGQLKLRADNPDYGAQEFDLGQALEIWEVKAVFTTHLRPPSALEERVSRLERQVEELLSRLDKEQD
ncbi:LexA family transcriptional regulator [Hymenobacter sp. 15J16-1T3B]|uniref:LexA family transcriptional regulator n=1 Tax=Hymenobacter sp. 15J16-1T3B TaxID=2886941 RepID=UPI001D0F5326|nr:LexA family transcriptional regulator [Hymenobacter sp. 15J16-1T3B]MCC3159888.1 LexA family transcriptional regulator [Hymenobacter sp. 15J16-1T3B]